MGKVATPPHFSQLFGAMKEIVLRVEDSALEKFLGFIQLCQKVEVVSTNAVKETRSLVDQCFFEAISELRQDKAFRTKGDYGYVMLAVNDGVVKGLFFYSPLEYVNYLKDLGFDQLPVLTTLYNNSNRVNGKYPDWEFRDHPDNKEKLRRKNIVVRFLSAFNRAKRGQMEGKMENQQ